MTAKDQATDREQDITITGSGQLSDTDVSGMVQDAKAYEEEDAKFKELAGKAGLNVDKFVKDLKDKDAAYDKAIDKRKFRTFLPHPPEDDET